MKGCQPITNATSDVRGRPAGLEEEIRRRAYEIWEDRGRREGKALEDWCRAEAEMLSHKVMRRAA